VTDRCGCVASALLPGPQSWKLAHAMPAAEAPAPARAMQMVVKRPGLDMDTEMSELDLSYADRWGRAGCTGGGGVPWR
jgi:hypothetical protein